MTPTNEKLTDRTVLMLISGGLILIIMGIVVGIFTTPRALPNWAENVLVAIASTSALKLGDCLSTLIALSSGRSVERLGTQLAATSPAAPAEPPPAGAVEAAAQTAEAAQDRANEIAAQADGPEGAKT